MPHGRNQQNDPLAGWRKENLAAPKRPQGQARNSPETQYDDDARPAAQSSPLSYGSRPVSRGRSRYPSRGPPPNPGRSPSRPPRSISRPSSRGPRPNRSVGRRPRFRSASRGPPPSRRSPNRPSPPQEFRSSSRGPPPYRASSPTYRGRDASRGPPSSHNRAPSRTRSPPPGFNGRRSQSRGPPPNVGRRRNASRGPPPPRAPTPTPRPKKRLTEQEKSQCPFGDTRWPPPGEYSTPLHLSYTEQGVKKRIYYHLIYENIAFEAINWCKEVDAKATECLDRIPKEQPPTVTIMNALYASTLRVVSEGKRGKIWLLDEGSEQVWSTLQSMQEERGAVRIFSEWEEFKCFGAGLKGNKGDVLLVSWKFEGELTPQREE
jgi:hypothetical protein